MNTLHTQTQKKSSKTMFIAWMTMLSVVFSFVGLPNAYAAITGQLDLGDRGAEVSELQTYLATDTAIYPSGLVTGYFGQLTQTGVQRFQTAQSIVSSGTPATTGYGRVGPATRAAINAKLGGDDVSAPRINSVDITAGETNAVISWTASEASFGKVYYDTSPLRLSNMFDITGVFSGEPVVTGTLAEYDDNARVTHTVNINNLTSDTTYYYIVVVFDASKNISITLPAHFRTTK
ncbi:MAG: hypothetical protein HGB03_04155 [Candidatus Yonathbacteria bacterium]|nr:hypothetical protein [Candidatus Yonathbacteria bacterium]NTW47578.1 hypothetical protein [Candidatus Yonathbacteria bacterium]